MDSPVESGDQRYRFEEEKKNVFFFFLELENLKNCPRLVY